VIQGAVLLVNFLFMLVNILTDALYALLDPRVRES
jgi:peptide/nickel transport system permease protein